MIWLALTFLAYGLRHGIDWDHIAAITDVTSGQDPRRGLRVASAYAAGHGAVVMVLGIAAILGGELLPEWLDAAMGRLVGVTLLILAAYVVVGLLKDRRDFRLRSRWMLLAAGLTRARRWTRDRIVEIRHDHGHDHAHDGGHGHGHDHPADGARQGDTRRVALGHRHEHLHVAVEPADPFVTTGTLAAVLLGVVHGIGAETPTQVLVFLAAAHVAGAGAGIALLAAFIGGIFLSNTAVAVASSYGYLSAARNFRVYAGVALVNAAFSVVIGTIFLTGGTLPAIIGG